MNKIQYWKNGIMMGLVDIENKKQMIETARNAGYKVYDNGHYFSIETN